MTQLVVPRRSRIESALGKCLVCKRELAPEDFAWNTKHRGELWQPSLPHLPEPSRKFLESYVRECPCARCQGWCLCFRYDQSDRSKCYVMSDGKYVKIGWAIRPEKRLRQLQTGHPRELSIKCLFAFGRETEAFLHQMLAPCRYRSEWFRRDAQFRAIFNPWVEGTDLLLYGGPL